MELGPILRALAHNKVRFWLIALEVALTLAIVVNCLSLILDLRSEYTEPTGYDEENLIAVRTEPFAPELAEEEYRNAVQDRDLERLQAIPGVRAATAIASIPLSGGGSATGRRPIGSEADPSTAPYFEVYGRPLETLGVELVAGRDFVPTDFEIEANELGGKHDQPIIVSRPFAETLFPDGDALGQVIESRSGEESNVIVGIVDRMDNSWPWSDSRRSAMLVPERTGSERLMRYMVRTEPGARDEVFAKLEEVLLASEPGRIVSTMTMEDVKKGTYGGSLALIKMLSATSILLVLVTCLGIVGLTSFSVTQRTRQIGTRRALGATKRDILRYFLVENWVVTGLGLVLGVALSYGLGYWLTRTVEAPALAPGLLAAGILLLWAVGIAAAAFPAWRATTVSPEVATRTV